jgi:nucleoside-triphosphatase
VSKVILLTGPPGCGKTTAIKLFLSTSPRQAGGFFSQEIREAGRRVGFKIVTLDGEESVLAHVDFKGQPRVGKYGVNLEAIDEVAVVSLERAKEHSSIIIIDEIGPMEILSQNFCHVVTGLLKAEVDILGSIVKRKLPFTDLVKTHAKVTVLEIHQGNRNQIVAQIHSLLSHVH